MRGRSRRRGRRVTRADHGGARRPRHLRRAAELQDNGQRVNRKRVARVMHRFGVQGLRLRRRVTTTFAHPASAKAPDLIGGDFTRRGDKSALRGPNAPIAISTTAVPAPDVHAASTRRRRRTRCLARSASPTTCGAIAASAANRSRVFPDDHMPGPFRPTPPARCCRRHPDHRPRCNRCVRWSIPGRTPSEAAAENR